MFKRFLTLKSIAVAEASLAAALGWLTYDRFTAGDTFLGVIGLAATVSLLIMFSISLDLAQRAANPRAYARPMIDPPSVFSLTVRSLFPIPSDKKHPTLRAGYYIVKFDDKSTEKVDKGLFYQRMLIAWERQRAGKGPLSERFWVKKIGWRQWASTCTLVRQAGKIINDGDRRKGELTDLPWGICDAVEQQQQLVQFSSVSSD